MLDATPPSLARDGAGSAGGGPHGNLMHGGLALARGGGGVDKNLWTGHGGMAKDRIVAVSG